MSEAELHLIRERLNGGLRNKAARGELRMHLPVGFDRDEDGQIVLSADEQVRHTIGRVFELWRRTGSARQVVGELIADGQLLPRRATAQRRVLWARASYGAVLKLLTNPVYAGAFVYGRSRQEKRVDADGQVRVKTVRVPVEEWSVCLPQHHPGYVSWEEYLATRERLRANVRPRGEGGGAAREGRALLQGLVRCGRCGRRMRVAYSGDGGRCVRYACLTGFSHHGTDATCQSLGGGRLDQAVAAAFLDAVTPAGAGVSSGAIAELTDQHDARVAGQRLALERAEFEAERARRQFDACEPEHRLVARTLERKLEEALAGVQREQRALASLEVARPAPLSDHELRALKSLARDLPKLWAADTTSDRDRKELLRTLITEVVVTVTRPENIAGIEVFWEGGARSELSIRLLRRGGERQRTSEDTIALIARLAVHHPDDQIAGILNKQGRRTGAGLPFTATRVKSLRQRKGIPDPLPPDPDSQTMSIKQAAGELGVCHTTVYRWLRAGLLPGEQITPNAPWRVRLTDEIRSRFVPDVPDGYLPLDEAAKRLGVARQTVLHQVQRGQRHAIQVTQGRRQGLRIQVQPAEAGLLAQ
jgi:transposase